MAREGAGAGGMGGPGAPGLNGPEDLLEIMNLYKASGGEMDPEKVPEDVRPFVEMFQQLTALGEQEGQGQGAAGQGRSQMDDPFNVMGGGLGGGGGGGGGGASKGGSAKQAAAAARIFEEMKGAGDPAGGVGSAGGGGARKATQEIVPEAGFVVKCLDDNGRKIFINMCGSDKVAAPGSWEEGKIPDNIAEKLDKAHIAPDESLR